MNWELFYLSCISNKNLLILFAFFFKIKYLRFVLLDNGRIPKWSILCINRIIIFRRFWLSLKFIAWPWLMVDILKELFRWLKWSLKIIKILFFWFINRFIFKNRLFADFWNFNWRSVRSWFTRRFYRIPRVMRGSNYWKLVYVTY